MPPKNKKKEQEKQQKREEEKKKQRIIEDKTFGLKNKNKSKQVQKYIKGVQQQVAQPNKSEKAMMEQQNKARQESEKKKADQALLASLFKTVTSIPKDTEDPKRVICSYYKQGLCSKGNKCKFSHDLTAEPLKQEKPNLYNDPRPVKNNITCNFFLEAVESNKYGWFWKCPNGDDCIYRHCLPEGYILKTEEEKRLEAMPEIEDETPFEYTLDEERTKIGTEGPKVTFDMFMKWLADQKEAKAQKEEKKAGLKGMSGRAMFTYDPSLFRDDDAAVDEYGRVEEEEAKHDPEVIEEATEEVVQPPMKAQQDPQPVEA